MRTVVVKIIVLLSLCLCSAEAAVTEWTNPIIQTAANGSGVATPNIAENTAVGPTAVTITATAGSPKTYAIASQPTTGKLTIGPTSGLLSLSAGHSFDFESEPSYILQITCKDGADNSTGTATVTLRISNINESPVFTSELYKASIADGATAETMLITVTATDEDAGASIAYSITDGNAKGDFAIGGTTGAIKVAMDKTLNRTVTSEYLLTIKASDGTNEVTTTVQATVTTLNSGTPVFLVSITIMCFVMVSTVM